GPGSHPEGSSPLDYQTGSPAPVCVPRSATRTRRPMRKSAVTMRRKASPRSTSTARSPGNSPVVPAICPLGAGAAALVVGDGVLEVCFAGVPGAGGEGAGAVADLDQVAEGVVGLVAV